MESFIANLQEIVNIFNENLSKKRQDKYQERIKNLFKSIEILEESLRTKMFLSTKAETTTINDKNYRSLQSYRDLLDNLQEKLFGMEHNSQEYLSYLDDLKSRDISNIESQLISNLDTSKQLYKDLTNFLE